MPIQAHVNREKVDNMKQDPECLDQPVFCSNEGLILDGHHRWVAKSELEPAGTIHAIVPDCGIKELVALAHQFEGSETKSLHEITIYGQKIFEDECEDEQSPIELMVRKTLRPY